MITVLMVDDHPLLREGIAAVIDGQPDMQLIGEAADGTQAVAKLRHHQPDVTLMDLQMPGVGGTEASRAIRREFQTVKGHMKSILLKLQANDRTHAVTIALSRGIISF